MVFDGRNRQRLVHHLANQNIVVKLNSETEEEEENEDMARGLMTNLSAARAEKTRK